LFTREDFQLESAENTKSNHHRSVLWPEVGNLLEASVIGGRSFVQDAGRADRSAINWTC